MVISSLLIWNCIGQNGLKDRPDMSWAVELLGFIRYTEWAAIETGPTYGWAFY